MQVMHVQFCSRLFPDAEFHGSTQDLLSYCSLTIGTLTSVLFVDAVLKEYEKISTCIIGWLVMVVEALRQATGGPRALAFRIIAF